MATRLDPRKVLDDINKIMAVWNANADFSLGTVTLADTRALAAKLGTLDETIDTRRVELTGLMDERDDAARAVNEIVTRAKSGFRAVYGPDSPQYAQSGGVRRSERKAATRKEPQPKQL